MLKITKIVTTYEQFYTMNSAESWPVTTRIHNRLVRSTFMTKDISVARKI